MLQSTLDYDDSMVDLSASNGVVEVDSDTSGENMHILMSFFTN